MELHPNNDLIKWYFLVIEFVSSKLLIAVM